MKASYTFFDKRIQLITSIGATLNVFSKTNLHIIPEDKSIDDFHTSIDYTYEKINLSPTISVGLKYKLNQRMNLQAEPTFQYAIKNIDEKSHKSTHLWNFGLNFGYYYKF